MTDKQLLTCGIVAGPLFLVVWLLQALTREGFDPGKHPISLLSLGDMGWIQIANFVVTGILFVACAVGLRRALQTGPGHKWGPRLVGVLGIGLIVGGVFVTDAGAGFPAGAPEGAPEQITVHGMLHGVGAVLAFNGMIVGCIVFARRFAALKQRGWFWAAIATAVSVFVLSSPGLPGYSIRLVVGCAILFGFVAALAARTISDLDTAGTASARRSYVSNPDISR